MSKLTFDATEDAKLRCSNVDRDITRASSKDLSSQDWWWALKAVQLRVHHSKVGELRANFDISHRKNLCQRFS